MVSARGITENLVSNAIWAMGALAVGGIGVLLAYLSPALSRYAPFSYFAAALFTLALVAIIIGFGAWIFRLIKPLPTPASSGLPVLDHKPADGDLASVQATLVALQEKITAVHAAYAAHIVGVNAKIQELEQPGPGDYLAYERWLDLQLGAIDRVALAATSPLNRALSLYQEPPSREERRIQPEAHGAAAFAAVNINKITSALLGKTYEFSGKAALDDNPHRPVPGDEGIDDPARRHEYRKAYYDLKQIESTVDTVKRDIGAERSKVYNAMIRFGQELERGKLK